MTTSAAALAPLVDAVVRTPLPDLSAAELQALIAALAPQVARLEGLVQAASAELQARTGGEVVTDDGRRRPVAGWLTEVTRDTGASAGSDLRTGAALRGSLPAVARAVLDGVLTPKQAAVLSRLVGRIDDASLAEAQGPLIAVAAGRDPVELAAWVRHEIATHCEPALEADAERGRRRRYLQTRPEADGSVRGSFVLSAEDSETLLTVLEPLARRDGLRDDRTAGKRRADALVEVCEQVLRHGALPDAGGHRPQITYVLPADWAAARAAEAACSDCGLRCAYHQPVGFADTVRAALPADAADGPQAEAAQAEATGRAADAGGSGPKAPTVPAERACATAAWSGPQTRARIETMLCDARISRVLLDVHGQVRSLEELHDAITAAQRKALAARDLGCAAGGCTRPPAMCDAHHLVHRADGGATTIANLVLLCRRHHILWHLGKIHLRNLHVPWIPDLPEPDWMDALAARHVA